MHINIPFSTLRKAHFFLAWCILFFSILYVGLTYQNKVLSWPSENSINLQTNTDVWLRLTQIKQWIVNPDFYDHEVKNTNAPDGGVKTPWTRPMDALLVTGYLLTSDTYPIEKRLMLSATWIPLLIGAMCIFFITQASNYKFKNPYHTGLTIFCFLCSEFASYNFKPGDADHHGLQTLLFSIVLFLSLTRPLPLNSILMGVAIGIWMWVTPEPLMFLAPLYLFWGIQIIHNKLNPSHATRTSFFAFCTSLIALLIEKPPSQLWTVEYDTLSIVYVTLFGAVLIGFFVLKNICSVTSKLSRRYIGALCLSILITLFFHLTFPLFYKGPLAEVNPELFWINIASKTPEALPIWAQAPQSIYAILILPLIAILLSCFYCRKTPTIFLFFFISLISIFFQMRWFYYLEASAILIIARFLPSFLRIARQRCDELIHIFLIPYLIIFLFIYIGYSVNNNPTTQKIESIQKENAYKLSLLYNVQTGHLDDLIPNKNAIILSNFYQMGGNLLFFTPYKIPTAYFHREVEKADEMRQLFEAPSELEARPLLIKRKINYLLICPLEPSWINEFFQPNSKTPDWVEEKIILPPAPNMKDFKEQSPLLIKINFNE